MKFRVSYSGQLKHEYRDRKDAKDMNVIGPELQNLINAVHTLPAYSQEQDEHQQSCCSIVQHQAH